jgi:hypothetical protein
MKSLFLILIVTTLWVNTALTQSHKQIACNIAFNQIDISYQQTIGLLPLWSEIYTGIGNADIDNKFNDFTAGLRIGTPIWHNDKNNVGIAAHLGMYIPNNDYYKATTPVYGIVAKYNHYFGTTKKHSLLVNAGYLYGKRSYKQEYSDPKIYTATTDEFRLMPLYLSLGYGFNF